MNEYLRRTTIAAATAWWAVCGGDGLRAAEDPPAAVSPKKPAATSSLDDELFRDLDRGSVVPGNKPPSGDAQPPPSLPKPTKSEPPKSRSSGPPPPRSPLDDELLRRLEGGDRSAAKPSAPSGDAAADPLRRLVEQIREAEQRMRRSDSGRDTQELQQKIVADLEKLIAEAQRRRQQQKDSSSQSEPSSSAGKRQPGQPQPQPSTRPGGDETESSQAADSSDATRRRRAERPDGGRLQDLLEKAWGVLPERQRQEIMQSSADDFPGKYQGVIEEYFETLLRRRE